MVLRKLKVEVSFDYAVNDFILNLRATAVTTTSIMTATSNTGAVTSYQR